MNLGLDFRRGLDTLPSVLESVVARINTLWKKEHKIDGTHAAITADSISATGAGTIGGALALTGSLNLLGGQIRFPATANPSTDPNTLDDYREGSWTPELAFSTTGVGGLMYSHQSGYYFKIGKLVHWTFYFVLSGKAGTVGNAYVRGFPFPASVANPLQVGTAGYWAGFPGLSSPPVGFVQVVGTETRLQVGHGTGGWVWATDANVTSGSALIMAGFYRTD